LWAQPPDDGADRGLGVHHELLDEGVVGLGVALHVEGQIRLSLWKSGD
jgi:hypothetical protein